MNSRGYIRKGFQHGAATSAGKMKGRCGVRQRRIAPGEVSDGELARDIARGADHFWATRTFNGIFPMDTAWHHGGGRASA